MIITTNENWEFKKYNKSNLIVLEDYRDFISPPREFTERETELMNRMREISKDVTIVWSEGHPKAGQNIMDSFR